MPRAKASPDTKLTKRQQAFVDAYIGSANENATEAAKLAGYKPNNAGQMGYQLLKKPHIAKIVEAHHENLRKAKLIDEYEIQCYLAEVIKAARLKAVDASHSDALKATDQLAKRHGSYAATKSEISGPGGTPVNVTLVGSFDEALALASLKDDEVKETK